MTKELLDIITEIGFQAGESELIEFKLNNKKPEMIGEYISALSNSACRDNQIFGFLVYGFNDETMEFEGTDFNPEKRIGNQDLEIWLMTQLDPRINFKIFNEIVDKKRLVVFKIDATFNTPVTFKGIAHIRIGKSLTKLKYYPEIERKIWNNHLVFEFERGVALRSQNEHQIYEKINITGFFELLGLPPTESGNGYIARLIEENVIELGNNAYNIINLGALLFANYLANFDNLYRKSIRVIQYKGPDRINAVKEQIGQKGYAIGFLGVVKYIIDSSPTEERVVDGKRDDFCIYPSIAIRELVANSIIHQDLSIKGTSPMIEIFENRVEFTNPGKPIIDTLRFIDHSPISRNEKLAELMRRMNFAEERGSGIDKVIAACAEYKLPGPEFIVEEFSTKVILFGPKDINDMDKDERVRTCYQYCVLLYIKSEKMTNKDLCRRFNIKTKTKSVITKIINDTMKAGLIKKSNEHSNSRKFASYIPEWA
jgi:ATP-dependent DNA helicase RecG